MSLAAALSRQFARPTGVAGQLAGWIMATRPSNRDRNMRTVALLDLKPCDHVLELGCGPGVALARAAAMVTTGRVVGIDHSPTMVKQAAARNAVAIRQGTLTLIDGGLDLLRSCPDRFDKVFSVNLFQFLPDHRQALTTIGERMRAGALLATTYMPRGHQATAGDAGLFARALAREMRTSGFHAIRIEKFDLKPMPAVCVVGQR